MNLSHKLEEIRRELSDRERDQRRLMGETESVVSELEADIEELERLRKSIKKEMFFAEGKSDLDKQIEYIDLKMADRKKRIEATKASTENDVKVLEERIQDLRLAYITLGRGALPLLFENWCSSNHFVRQLGVFAGEDCATPRGKFQESLERESKERQCYITTLVTLRCLGEVTTEEILKMEAATRKRMKEFYDKALDGGSIRCREIESSVLGSYK